MTSRYILLSILSLIICVSSERWSRQISNTGDNIRPEEINDWVPLTHPIKHIDSIAATSSTNDEIVDRSKNARVLSFPQTQNQFFHALFNSNPQTPSPSIQSSAALTSPEAVQQQYQQHYLIPTNDQINQNNIGLNRNLQPQSPTSQSFFKFEMPSFNKDGTKQTNLPTVQTRYQIQHSFPHQSVVASPLFSQKPVFPTDFYPQFQPLIGQKILQHNTIDDGKRPVKDKIQEGVKSAKLPEITTPQPQIQFPINPNFQIQRPTSFQAKFPFQGQLTLPTSQEEEVQLLYVPYDTLYHQRNEHYQLNNKFSGVPPPISPSQINNFYTPEPLSNVDQKIYSPTPSTTTSTTFKPSTTYNAFLNPHFTTSPKPKHKLKPHQPPLAMFMYKGNNRPQSSVNDVLQALSSAKSISVLDAPTQIAPPVFIGPAGLPIPSGYSKFELPYLSAIDRNHLESRLQELPFFVAPLSYKAPLGFNKITLPEPHVGSVIVNKPFTNIDTNFVQQQELRKPTQKPIQSNKQVYITPFEDARYQSTTPKTSPTPARYRYQFGSEVQSSTNGYYNNNEQYQDVQSITSPRPPPPSRNQNINRNRPYFQKRPDEKYQNPTARPYTNFKSTPNHVVNEEYFKVNPITSSASPTTSTTTTTENPRQYLTETNILNQLTEDKTVRLNQIYNDVSSPQPEITRQRFNTRPNQYPTTNDEEYRMKTYFREQEAFRNRQKIQGGNQTPTSNEETIFENVQYTPVSVDYDRQQQLYSIPSSTPSYFEGSTLRTTTPKERVTFYTPIPQNQEIESIRQPDEPVQYTHEVISHSPQPEEQPTRPTTTSSTHHYQETSEQIKENNIPSNHRPTYSNEITYNHNTKIQGDDTEVEYEPNPYKLPTELPPLTPNLPGLVNALIEKDRLNAIEKENSTTENPTTLSISYQPTRRPIHRAKKPTIKVSSSTSVSYSSSSDNGRRTIVNRGRRPYNPRNNNQTTSSSSPTAVSTTSKSQIIRNPNRIRYNPTPEERRRYRPRIRTNGLLSSSSSSKLNKDEEDNLEYQRDVLKQNYPVFKPTSRKTSSITTSSTTERITEASSSSSSQSVMTVTPSSDKNEFAGLLEPMQIAQEYQQSPNYGPGYFPNAEEAIATEPIDVEKNEIHPVYTGSVTTEQIRETTRRPSFIRRLSRPTRTTTETPQTTTVINEERYTIRTRTRPENGQRTRVVKIRTRTRKPHPASTTSTTTTTSGPERRTHDSGYHQLNRFNQELIQDNRKDEANNRSHKKSNYNLEAQESKWSLSLSHADSFHPVDPEDKAKYLKENKKFENEPEIVTAAPESESKIQQNTYLFNVSAGFGSSNYESKNELKPNAKNNSLNETTFADLLEEAVSDNENDKNKQTVTNSNNTNYNKLFKQETEKNRNEKHSLLTPPNRRGAWRRVRLNPNDSFETAESQNLGNQIYNSIFAINNHQKQQQSELLKQANGAKLSNKNTSDLINANDSNYDDEEVTTIVPNQIVFETELPTIQTKSHEKYINTPLITTTNPKDLTTSQIITTANKNYIETSTIDNYDYYMNMAGDITTDFTITKPDNVKDDSSVDNKNNYHNDENTDHNSNNNSNSSDNDDLESQPSLFDEVRKQLSNLFAIEDNDNDKIEDIDNIKPKFKPRKQEYTSIQRIRAVSENNPTLSSLDKKNTNNHIDDKNNSLSNRNNNINTNNNLGNNNFNYNNKNNNISSSNSDNYSNSLSSSVTTTQTSPFHKNLMKNVIYATSTSTEISHETEICYRGRCVKATKQLL